MTEQTYTTILTSDQEMIKSCSTETRTHNECVLFTLPEIVQHSSYSDNGFRPTPPVLTGTSRAQPTAASLGWTGSSVQDIWG